MKIRAFTLVEILVVITILSVLAAILFPVFSRAKERAKQTTSSSNLRQIGIATIIYADDSDQVLPFFRNNEFLLLELDPAVTTSGVPTDSTQPSQLIECLKPYTKSTEIWFTDGDSNKRKPRMFGNINHTYTSYEYLAIPDGYDSDKNRSFPIVTRLEALHQAGVLFCEPVSKTTPLSTYWSSNVRQFVHADSHISSYRIQTP